MSKSSKQPTNKDDSTQYELSTSEAQASEKMFVSGSLAEKDSGRLLSYWPVEISNMRMVIKSLDNCTVGSTIVLEIPARRTLLTVKSCIMASDAKDGSYQLELAARDPQARLEDRLKEIEELKEYNWSLDPSTMQASKKTRQDLLYLRAARFPTLEPMKVLARTFGTRDPIVLFSQNVSKSGLLMSEKGAMHSFFSLQTLLELVIDPEGKHLQKPLSCLGKVVRRTELPDEERHVEYGVQLIDVTGEDQKRWHQFVEKLEHHLADLTKANAQ